MRTPPIICAFLLAANAASAQNIVLNGDFEANSATGCHFQLANSDFDAIMQNCRAFGDLFGGTGALDVLDAVGSCGYGASGPVGPTKVALECDGSPFTDAFSLALESQVIAGDDYRLSFWDYRHILPWYSGPAVLEIGVSSEPLSFDTLLEAFAVSNTAFARHESNFVAAAGGRYLTLRLQGNSECWIHVDGFELERGDITFTMSGACPGLLSATITRATPNGIVAVGYSPVAGTLVIPAGQPCAGNAALSGFIPAALCGYSVQVMDLATCDTSNVETF